MHDNKTVDDQKNEEILINNKQPFDSNNGITLFQIIKSIPQQLDKKSGLL